MFQLGTKNAGTITIEKVVIVLMQGGEEVR